MSHILVTWLDGKQESYPVEHDDRVFVDENVLHIIHSKYPAHTDKELSKNIPLLNVRIYNLYE